MTTEAEKIIAAFQDCGLQILVSNAGLIQHLIEISEDKSSLQKLQYNLDHGQNFDSEVPINTNFQLKAKSSLRLMILNQI
jgi:hypothetical protein